MTLLHILAIMAGLATFLTLLRLSQFTRWDTADWAFAFVLIFLSASLLAWGVGK
jgi:hypothetical protein